MTTTIIKKRIEYLDALRGFTMLLVIFSHVELFCFGLSANSSILNTLFIQFRMPLFFFVSGFLAYNPKIIWTGNTWISATKKKLRVQIIPTLIFGLLFTYLVSSESIYTFFAAPMKLGYWFTISLLEMFLIYYTVNYLVYKCGRNQTGGGKICRSNHNLCYPLFRDHYHKQKSYHQQDIRLLLCIPNIRLFTIFCFRKYCSLPLQFIQQVIR